MNFFELKELEGTYLNVDSLIQSRNFIVDKFLPKFIGEKSYDTIQRYFNLLLVEYCEFLNALAETEREAAVGHILEELADVVLYQASLSNEILKRTTVEDNDMYFFREELRFDRSYKTTISSVTSLKFDSIFTTYFQSIFNQLIDLYPDRKYHRGDIEPPHPEQERTVRLIKSLEQSTVDMVIGNIICIFFKFNDDVESPENLINRFNDILNYKIEVVNDRLKQDYPVEHTAIPIYDTYKPMPVEPEDDQIVGDIVNHNIVPEEDHQPSLEENLASQFSTVITEDFKDSEPVALPEVELLSISSEENVPIVGLTTWEAVFRYSGDITKYNLETFLKEADLEEDLHKGIYEINPTPTTTFLPVEGQFNTYKVSWIV